MQKGGIVINQGRTPEEAYNFFIDNSTCIIQTHQTSGGIVFKLTLHIGIPSPYSVSRSNDPNAEVRIVILKIVFLNDIGKTFTIITSSGNDFLHLNYVTTGEFRNEIDIQTEIFTRSLDEFLEPICPSIVFTDIVENAGIIPFITRLSQNIPTGDTTNAAWLCHRIIINPRLHYFRMGTIMMECLTGFENLIKFPKNEVNEGLSIFELWKLYQLGFIHGDPHKSNLMFCSSYEYVQGTPGRSLIIDFGASFRNNHLPPIDRTNMIEVTDASRNNSSPMWDAGTALKHPGYQWLDFTDPVKRASMVTCLEGIYANRELAKHSFTAHVMAGTIPNLNPGTIYPSSVVPHIDTTDEIAAAAVLSNSPTAATAAAAASPATASPATASYATANSSPSASLAASPDLFNGFSGGKRGKRLKKQQRQKQRQPINFNKFDPTHIFTPIYIKNYIYEEHKYATEIKQLVYKKQHKQSRKRRNSNKNSNRSNKNSNKNSNRSNKNSNRSNKNSNRSNSRSNSRSNRSNKIVN